MLKSDRKFMFFLVNLHVQSVASVFRRLNRAFSRLTLRWERVIHVTD